VDFHYMLLGCVLLATKHHTITSSTFRLAFIHACCWPLLDEALRNAHPILLTPNASCAPGNGPRRKVRNGACRTSCWPNQPSMYPEPKDIDSPLASLSMQRAQVCSQQPPEIMHVRLEYDLAAHDLVAGNPQNRLAICPSRFGITARPSINPEC